MYISHAPPLLSPQSLSITLFHTLCTRVNGRGEGIYNKQECLAVSRVRDWDAGCGEMMEVMEMIGDMGEDGGTR